MLAAIEQFMRDTAPRETVQMPAQPSPWQRAALAEGVSRQPQLPR